MDQSVPAEVAAVEQVNAVVAAASQPRLKPFDKMAYHPTSEKLVDILCAHTQSEDRLFFRVMTGFYLSLAATQMRCAIKFPDGNDIPVNNYALNLAPSGYGKTKSMSLLEDKLLGQFRTRFVEDTFATLAEQNLPKIAVKRANRNGTDPDAEEAILKKIFYKDLGELLFSFDSGTSPAVKQMRSKLLLANAGSMNLIMDEVGANLIDNMEVFNTFIELYDKGVVKQKLVKNTNDSVRIEEIHSQTPANLMMFGVPSRLLDGAKTEEALMTMLDMGYARRCFFGYVRSTRRSVRTAEQIFLDRTNKAHDTTLESLADHFYRLADIINANKKLQISKDTCLLLFDYQINCEARSERFREHQETLKREMSERYFKVLKLAGAYAFADDSPTVTNAHIEAAIRLAEDSGEAFHQLLSRDKPWVKLAKFIGSCDEDVTQADLAEELPFYKGGTGVKQDLMNQAIAWGYKNNIIIKKTFADGIEFLRGETLRQTDLAKMVVAYSDDITTGYRNETAPFDQLHKLTQAQGMHWVSHHLSGGYRNEDNAIPGFNLVVLDVENSASLSTAKLLLKDYKFLAYTTKRHTDASNRFRIILPISHELKLDAKDYKEFYKNVLEWLPFEAEAESCATRSKKWLSHNGHYEYNDGEVLDALPFIPKTSKNEERKKLLNSQQSMDNLERWVMNNIGDGNRNNMLLRYAMILLDAGFDFEGIRSRVSSLNDKIVDKLDEIEIMSTIMVTITKALAKR
jgi:hypothetical protein